MEKTTQSGELTTDVLELTAEIVSAHVANNYVVAGGLPELIQSVYRSLATAGTREPVPVPPTPAAPVRKSVFPDHIVCLEDGQEMKTLKRHLQASHGMTPEAYRQKWGLPASYPMVAPNYARLRSSTAKRAGFGKKPRNRQPANLAGASQQPDPPAEAPVIRGPARRARGYKG